MFLLPPLPPPQVVWVLRVSDLSLVGALCLDDELAECERRGSDLVLIPGSNGHWGLAVTFRHDYAGRLEQATGRRGVCDMGGFRVFPRHACVWGALAAVPPFGAPRVSQPPRRVGYNSSGLEEDTNHDVMACRGALVMPACWEVTDRTVLVLPPAHPDQQLGRAARPAAASAVAAAAPVEMGAVPMGHVEVDEDGWQMLPEWMFTDPPTAAAAAAAPRAAPAVAFAPASASGAAAAPTAATAAGATGAASYVPRKPDLAPRHQHSGSRWRVPGSRPAGYSVIDLDDSDDVDVAAAAPAAAPAVVETHMQCPGALAVLDGVSDSMPECVGDAILIVEDILKHRVCLFNLRTHALVRVLGEWGRAPGQLILDPNDMIERGSLAVIPAALTPTHQPWLIVADAGNGRVQVWDLAGAACHVFLIDDMFTLSQVRFHPRLQEVVVVLLSGEDSNCMDASVVAWPFNNDDARREVIAPGQLALVTTLAVSADTCSVWLADARATSRDDMFDGLASPEMVQHRLCLFH